jgi:UDP-N-acetyl-D-glucosamine dehydrogenase
MELLLEDNVKKLHYNDPWVPSVQVNGSLLKSKPLTPALLAKMDVVVITTDHSDYDYDMIVKHAKVVVDTRNATKNVKGAKKHVTVLGDGKK